MRRLVAALISLALFMAGAPRAAADITEWRTGRSISDGPPGATVIELDGRVLQSAKPDLSDLRIFDGDLREIPWLELIPPSRAVERHPVTILDVMTDATNARSSFVCDLGQTGRVTNQVALSTGSRDFFKRLSFEVSNDLKSWQSLTGDPCYIYDLTSSGGGAQLIAGYPETSCRYLRVNVADLGTPPLADLRAELRRYVPTARDERAVPAVCLAQGINNDATWTVLDLATGGTAPVRFEVTTEAAAFHRVMIVEGSADRVAWTRVAQGTIFRTGEGEQIALSVPDPASAAFRFFRVSVQTGDDTPLLPERVTVYSVPRRVVFERTGGGPLHLLYGNPGAAAPRYDLARLRSLNLAKAVTATLGPEVPVLIDPERVTPTEPPKTDADPRYWRFERPLVVTAAGFVTVPLDDRIHNGARPDLADLRLVDGAGRAVPYVIRRSTDALPLTFRVLNKGSVGEDTWWVLDLGARNTPSHLVRIGADGTNFTRAVRVEGSNDGESWSQVAAGRIRRAETIFGREDNLVQSYPEARYRYLRVTIQGGIGGFAPVEVRGFGETVLFAAQPALQYRLFYGNPEAPVIDYPPQLFVDAYSPATLGEAALGREVDHNPPSKLPWFLKPGDGPGVSNPASRALSLLLWGLLALLVIGLSWLTFRVFRSLTRQQPK